MTNRREQWRVRPAHPNEAPVLAQVHSASFKAAYLNGDASRDTRVTAEAEAFLQYRRVANRRKLISRALTAPETDFYQVAVDDTETPVGFLSGVKTDAKQELFALYLAPDHFGSGAADALVEEFVGWCDADRPIELGVVKDNERAQKFYVRMGFQALHDDRFSYYEFLPETTMIRPATNKKEG